MLYIYSFVGNSNLYLHNGTTDEQTIELLKSLMGSKKKFNLVRDNNGTDWITFSKSHLELAIATLPDRFGGLKLIKEYNNRQECTTSCQAAKRDKCECSCLGKSHKGGEGLWINVTGDLLIKNEKTTVEYTYKAGWEVSK